MNEWGVYLVVASLLATGILIGKPIASLTKINTKLECSVESLNNTITQIKTQIEKVEDENHESHARLWKHNERQDEELKDHNTRITVLEKKQS